MSGECLELLGTMWMMSAGAFLIVFCYTHIKLLKK